jgi:hypothetical protein
MSDTEEKQAPNVIQHPAQATHMALPTDVMNELISMTAAKYTWAELDPLMSGKVKKLLVPMRVAEDGAVTVIKPPPE